MQPILPPKPSIPSQSTTLTPTDDTIIDETLLNIFKSKHNGTIPQIPLPDFLQWVSNSKIKEFLKDKELQKGYLEILYEEEFKTINAKRLELVELERQRLMGLLNDINGNINNVNELINKFNEYNKRVGELNDYQLDVFTKLNELSKLSLINKFNEQLLLIENQCTKLINDKINSNGKLSDDELVEFIETYTKLREKWHIIKEIIVQLNNGLVDGIV